MDCHYQSSLYNVHANKHQNLPYLIFFFQLSLITHSFSDKTSSILSILFVIVGDAITREL